MNKWTSDYYKPSVDFQSYEKVDFDKSANIINAYVEWWLFRGPCAASATNVTLKSLHFLMLRLEIKQLAAESFEKETSLSLKVTERGKGRYNLKIKAMKSK